MKIRSVKKNRFCSIFAPKKNYLNPKNMKQLFVAFALFFAIGLCAQDAKKCCAKKQACTKTAESSKSACGSSASVSGTIESAGINAESLKSEGFEVSTNDSGILQGKKVCAHSGTTTVKEFNPSTGELSITKTSKDGEVLTKDVTVLEGNVKSAGSTGVKKACAHAEKKAGCCAGGKANTGKSCCAKKK